MGTSIDYKYRYHLRQVLELPTRTLVRSCQQPLNTPTRRSIARRQTARIQSRVMRNSLPASKTPEDFEIQVLNYLLLGEAGFYVVVEAGSSIYFKYPIFFGRIANVTRDHNVDAGKTQAHVTRQLYRHFLEFRMNELRHVERIVAAQEVRV